ALGASEALSARFTPDGDLAWSKQLGGALEDVAHGVAVDAAGNVIVAGWFEKEIDFGAGKVSAAANANKDVFVVKLAADGTLRWAKTCGDRDHDKARAVALDADGDPYVAGVFRFVM